MDTVWTKTAPTVPGLYWLRFIRYFTNADGVYQRVHDGLYEVHQREDGTLHVSGNGLLGPVAKIQAFNPDWAGPIIIPRPKEVTV